MTDNFQSTQPNFQPQPPQGAPVAPPFYPQRMAPQMQPPLQSMGSTQPMMAPPTPPYAAPAASTMQGPVPTTHTGGGSISGYITTGILSALLAFGGSILWAHFFPPKVPTAPAPIAIVDMLQLASGIATAKNIDPQAAYEEVGKAIARLEENGYIVMDTRSIIAAGDQYKIKPSQLIPGAADNGLVGGYEVPNLLEGVTNDRK